MEYTRMIRLVSPAVLLMMLAVPALAQAPNYEPAPTQPAPVAPAVKGMTLEKLVAMPDWQAAVAATAKAQFAEMPIACPAAQFQPTGHLDVFQPAQFGADGKPFAGAWTEAVNVTGCGPTRVLNVLTITHAEGAPARVALMPGTSRADPMTQKAALQYAQAVAGRAQPPGCRRQAFTEARFMKFDGPPNPEVTDGREARPWDEDWLVVACGTTFSINIRFKPNAGGTQLAASNPVKEH